jgi:hypothetical protein
LEELINNLKICGSRTNFQQFHDGFGLQDRRFRQCVIITELISDDLYDFMDWYISENTNIIKVNEDIIEIEGLQTSPTVRCGPNSL